MDQKVEPLREELKPDFDTTAELWDRIADDLMNNPSPCYETVEKLVGQACRLSKETEPDPGP